MALLVSSWFEGLQSMPKDYIMPLEKRPGDFVTVCKEIPVIDLEEKPGTGRHDIVQQILKASQEFGDKSWSFRKDDGGHEDFVQGFFQYKLDFYSTEMGKGCSLYTSGLDYAKEETHYWKDTLKHPCIPLEEHMPSWPNKPARYREEVSRYTVEVRKMGFRMLDLIREGLGLKDGYFEGELTQVQDMAINYYPPCPEPSLAMGIGGHTDPNLITFLQQDQYGLQVNKDGQWLGVEPIPNAFVVNLGYQLEIISNGKLKSAEHRGVTNLTAARTSIVSFFTPDLSAVIEPAKELVTSNNSQIFKAFAFHEFLENYLAYLAKPVPHIGTPLSPYML